MDEKLKKEIEQYETAGIDAVVTKNGKLVHVTGGINQDSNYCDSCSSLTFAPDPDPYDWFRDGDQKAVCMQMNAIIEGSLERPSEMVNIIKPLWCPTLGRKLSEKESALADLQLKIAQES